MRTELAVLVLLSACSTSEPLTLPYYATRDRYYSAIDLAADYARWCSLQAEQRECRSVVAEEASLAAKAKVMILHANARKDSGEKSGSPVAELGAKASVYRFTDYVSVHPIP